jgi:hypothetical protein
MNDRQIIVTALAGESASNDPEATNVLNIALEFLEAEAEELVGHFSPAVGEAGYSLAAAHQARCRALHEFVKRYMTAAFVEPSGGAS